MCRAEIQKKILHLQSKAPPNITYKNVVADYCRAHELKTSTTAIVEAIIVAIDKGLYLTSLTQILAILFHYIWYTF